MKKRITAIAAFLSLMPLAQPLVIGTAAVFTSAAVMLSAPEKAKAESAYFYFNRGVKKVEERDYYGAISDFNKAIEINPNDAVFYSYRGYTKRRLGDNYGAISEYTKAIEINPNDADSYFNRGNRKYALNDFTGSMFDYNKTIEINPKHERAYLNRGTLKVQLKDYYGAISDFDKIIYINSKELVYLDEGNRMAKSKTPIISSAYANRGLAKVNIGDMKGACFDWKKASSLGDEDAAKWVRNQC